MTNKHTGFLLGLLLVSQAAHADFPAPVPLDPAGVSTDPLHSITRDLAISPDGAQVYALEADNFSSGVHFISILARNVTTGRLGLSAPLGTMSAGDVLAMAPDGRHLYVGVDSFQSPGLRILVRDLGTGALSPGPVVTGPAFSGDGIALSPDGEHLYLSNGFGPGQVRVYDRDTVTGALALVEVETDGVAGVDGIWEPRDLVVSPDGAHVYVTGSADGALAIFARDGGSGALTFLGVVQDGVGGVSGLGGVTRVAMSPDGAHVYTVSNTADVAVFSRNAGTGALTFVEVQHDGVGGVTGMSEPFRIAVSSDGAFVYVLNRSYSLPANGVVVFARNGSTGALTFVDAEQEGGSGRHLAMVLAPGGDQIYVGGHGGVDTFDRNAGIGLLTSVQAIAAGRPFTLAVSPDGAHVYGTGTRIADPYGKPFVAVFARDGGDGSVTFVETVVQGAAGITSLTGVTNIAISSDGAHVYVTSPPLDTITVFARALPAGTLTLVETVQDGVGGVDGLDGVYGVALSPDGAHLYASGLGENAVAVFARNASTGELTLVEVQRDGLAGVDGLESAGVVLVSADGAHVYVRGIGDADEDAIAIFVRNSGTGALTFLGAAHEGVGGFTELPGLLAISPDGGHLYGVVTPSLKVIARSAITGLLSFAGTFANNADGASGVSGVVTVAPDGTHVYATGGAVMVRDAMSGALGFVERRAAATGTGGIAVSPDGRDVYFGNDPEVGPFASMLEYATRGFSGCGAAPLAGCRSAGRGRLRILTAGGDQLVWSYAKGEATDPSALGDPRDGRTHYALCMYQGGSPVLALRALAPAGGGNCRPTASNTDRRCWDDASTGFRYRDDFETPEGLASMKLKSGVEGRAGAKVRATGEHLRLPPLPLTLPLRVQLQAANGECWETTHATAQVNDGTRVIAPAD